MAKLLNRNSLFLGKKLDPILFQSTLRPFSSSSKFRIKVGDIEISKRIFTPDDVKSFAKITGDFNPIHVDPAIARSSQFGACIVHGSLTLGLVSGLIAQKIPGPGSVLLKQTIDYHAPLFVDEEVEARVEVLSYRHSIAKLKVSCKSGDDTLVLSGQVMVRYEEKLLE